MPLHKLLQPLNRKLKTTVFKPLPRTGWAPVRLRPQRLPFKPLLCRQQEQASQWQMPLRPTLNPMGHLRMLHSHLPVPVRQVKKTTMSGMRLCRN